MLDETDPDPPIANEELQRAGYRPETQCECAAAGQVEFYDPAGHRSLPDSNMDAALAKLDDGLRQEYSESGLEVDLRPTVRQKEGIRRALAFLDAAKHTSEPGVARGVVSLILDRHTAKQPVPPLIVRFLQQHWQSYLVRLCIVEGEQGPNWVKALESTEKLIWSVQPKYDIADRKRLFSLLPELFQWVHAVLESRCVSVADEDAFFAGLARLHAAALHPGKHPIDRSPGTRAHQVAANA